MRGKLEKGGHYELFLTTTGHRILNLNNKSWFVIVEGQEGEILVRSDADHEKDKTVKEGRFYLSSNNDNPEFNDMPHLLLEEGKKFRKWILPDDGPVGQDYQKKPAKTERLALRNKTEGHIAQKGLVSGYSQPDKKHLAQPLGKK